MIHTLAFCCSGELARKYYRMIWDLCASCGKIPALFYAETAKDLWELTRKQPLDGVLILLPEEQGIALYKEIRKRCPETKPICFYAGEKLPLFCSSRSFFPYPATPERLEQALSRLDIVPTGVGDVSNQMFYTPDSLPPRRLMETMESAPDEPKKMCVAVCAPYKTVDLVIDKIREAGPEEAFTMDAHIYAEKVRSMSDAFLYDIVWIAFPGLDGANAVHDIRSKNRNIPIVWMSENAGFVGLGHQWNVARFLSTDADPQEVRNAILTALSLAAQRAEQESAGVEKYIAPPPKKKFSQWLRSLFGSGTQPIEIDTKNREEKR